MGKIGNLYPRCARYRGVALALSLGALLMGSGPLHAADYFWGPNASTDGLWDTSSNWTDNSGATLSSFPQSSADRVNLRSTLTPNITLSSDITIGEIAISGSYSFTTNGYNLNLVGSGFTAYGQGGPGQPDVGPLQGQIAIYGSGSLNLYNTSTALNESFTNYANFSFNGSATSGSAFITNQGNLYFRDNSTSGASSHITNATAGAIYLYNHAVLGGGTNNILSNQGAINFHDTSSAGSQGISNQQFGTVNFYDNSTAAQSFINSNGGITFHNSSTAAGSTLSTGTNNGTIKFFDNATAGSAAIYIYNTNTTLNSPATPALGFNGNSTAGSATILNNGFATFNNFSSGGGASITNQSTGAINYNDSSSAGNAQASIQNYGAIGFHNGSTAGAANITQYSGATIDFYDSSTAGTAMLGNSGGSTINFHDNSSAGGASLVNNDGNDYINFGNNSTSGSATITNNGKMNFSDYASAGAANITNNHQLGFTANSTAQNAVITNVGGTLFFTGSASGGMAAVTNNNSDTTQGAFDISTLSTPGLTLGSIAGDGIFSLGSRNLTVGALGTNTTISGQIQDGGFGGGTGGSLTKVGSGTLTLTGGNSYTGGTTIKGGTVIMDISQDGSISDYSNLTIDGKGTFNYYNPGNTAQTAGKTQGQVFGTLTFKSGDGNVTSTLASTGTTPGTASFVVADSLAPRATGATGNFSDTNNSSAGVTGFYIGSGSHNIVTDSGFNPSAQRAAGFIDAGIFYKGTNYAWYDQSTGVRAINYSTDSGAFATSGTTSISTGPSHLYVQANGAITAQQTATFTTLNLTSGGNVTLASNATLTVQGILTSSAGSVAISGGVGSVLQAAANVNGDNELVTRVNAGDTLTINTAIQADYLTKSGGGALVLNTNYSGAASVNDGSLTTSGAITGNVDIGGSTFSLGNTGSITGNVTINSSGTLNGAGTVNGSVTVNNNGVLGGSTHVNGTITVSAGGSTYPGDPQVMNSGPISYNNGSSAQFAIESTTTPDSPRNVTAGTDYDQIRLSGSSPALTIGSSGTSGSAIQGDGTSNSNVTLQLNLGTGAAAALAAHASSSYVAGSTNADQNNYFLFQLDGASTTGYFSTLTITGLGTNGTDSLTGIIYYSGANDRFDGVAGVGDVLISGDVTGGTYSQEFAVSYTGNYATNSTTGGADLVITAIPEPGTWAMLAAGFGILALARPFRRFKAA